MKAEKLAAVIQRADSDPTFRGGLIWYPDKVIEAYGLSAAEATALRTGNMTGVVLSEEMLEMAARVFDLHDLHAGE